MTYLDVDLSLDNSVKYGFEIVRQALIQLESGWLLTWRLYHNWTVRNVLLGWLLL